MIQRNTLSVCFCSTVTEHFGCTLGLCSWLQVKIILNLIFYLHVEENSDLSEMTLIEKQKFDM